MTSKERLQQSLNHKTPDCSPIDFGATAVSGIHCKLIAELREHYGLEERPVKIIDPFQMLGEVDDQLMEMIPTDVLGVYGSKDVFGIDQSELHIQRTWWGQEVLIANKIDLTKQANGDAYIYAEGDRNYPPSGVMPDGCYFFNAIERQQEIDDTKLDPKDNLEEFGHMTPSDIVHWTKVVEAAHSTGRGVVASLGGAALGDAAFVPGMGLKEPKGIRSVTEWYMSTVMRTDYLHKIYDGQIDLAIANYQKIWEAVGDKIDVVFTCGTDFGSQESQFCSPESFNELWAPHYKRLNDWIHNNTSWKTFKHSCGAIIPLLPAIIDAGFDIINPVQISAKEMNSQRLKSEFGHALTFWGGGIDTQHTLPHSTPQKIREEVLRQLDILGKDGGFVFNAVHNIQANVPIENAVALFDTLRELHK